MSNQTSNLDLIAQNQSAKEATANALFDAASPATTLGRRMSTTAGMVWGYYGGIATLQDGSKISIPNDTKTLTPSTTNYLVVKKSDGVVSVSTSITNWNDTTNYSRLYLITTDATKVTDYNDYRSVFYTSVASGAAAVPITVADEGGQIAADLTALNFAGAGVTATAAGGAVTVTIPGGGGSALEIDDEGTPLTTGATKIDFVGAGVTSTNIGGAVTVTIPGGSGGVATPVEVADEGVMLTTIATKIDFKGAGVTATNVAGDVTVTIPGPTIPDMTINVQTASYTPVLADKNAYIVMNVATANNFTVPPNASVAYPVGANLHVRQRGLGQTTLVAGAGVTINTPETLKLRKKFSTVTLIQTEVLNVWDVMGDLELLP